MAQTTPQKEFTIQDAARRIFEEASFTIHDREVQDEMIHDIEESIKNFIDKKMLQALNPAQTEEFDALIASGPSDQDIQDFLSLHINDIPHIIKESVLQVRNQYLQAKAT